MTLFWAVELSVRKGYLREELEKMELSETAFMRVKIIVLVRKGHLSLA